MMALAVPPVDLSSNVAFVSDPSFPEFGSAGRFTLYCAPNLARTIEIVGPNGLEVLELDCQRSLYPQQLKTSSNSIFKAKAIILHGDETFTVVAQGGVVSHWACEGARHLHSVQVPNTLKNEESVLKVASLGNQVFISTTANRCYLYEGHQLKEAKTSPVS